jgi:hypothetical protein
MNRNVFALFGAVAMATVALTLSRATPFASGIGTLKCYDVTGAIEKPCDRQPLIVRTGVRHARLD